MAAADQIVWDDEQTPDSDIVWDTPVVSKKPSLAEQALAVNAANDAGVPKRAVTVNPVQGLKDTASLAAASTASPVLLGALGLLGRVTGQGTRLKDYAREHVTDPLVTPNAATVMTGVGSTLPAQAVAGVTGGLKSGLDAVVGKDAGDQISGTLGDLAAASPALGLAMRPLRAAAGFADRTPPVPISTAGVARTPIEQAEAAGLRILPSTVEATTGAGKAPSLLARATEGLANDNSLLTGVIRHNKPQTNSIAMQDLGRPAGTAISDTALEQAAKPHAQVYAAVKATIPDAIAPDETLTKAVMEAGRGTDSTLPLPPELKKYQDAALVPMNGSQMLATISDLRAQGWKGYLAKDNPQLNAVGNAQLELASALEQRLGQTVADRAPALAGAYQQARKGFAKIAAVEAARVGNDIDAQVLRRMNTKTGALDGGLKVIADTAEMFPKEMRLSAPAPTDLSRTSRLVLGVGSGGTIPLAQSLLSRAISATRGENKVPQLGPNGPLGYNYRGNESPLPATNPPLTLQPPPGRAFEPHQPNLFRTGEEVPLTSMPGLTLTPPPGEVFQPHQPSILRSGERMPLEESTQHLRPDGRLVPPPGRAFDPAQYDLLTMLAEKLRERE